MFHLLNINKYKKPGYPFEYPGAKHMIKPEDSGRDYVRQEVSNTAKMGAITLQYAKTSANNRQKGALHPCSRILKREAFNAFAIPIHVSAAAKKGNIHTSHHLSL